MKQLHIIYKVLCFLFICCTLCFGQHILKTRNLIPLEQDDLSLYSQNYFVPCLCSIFVNDNYTSQNIPVGDTYTKLNCWINDGANRNCIPNATNDQIIIISPGLYRIQFGASYFCDANNVTWRSAIFVNGVEQDNIHSARKNVAGADIVATSNAGYIEVITVPVSVNLRFRHNSNSSVNITVVYGNLNIVKVAN